MSKSSFFVALTGNPDVPGQCDSTGTPVNISKGGYYMVTMGLSAAYKISGSALWLGVTLLDANGNPKADGFGLYTTSNYASFSKNTIVRLPAGNYSGIYRKHDGGTGCSTTTLSSSGNGGYLSFRYMRGL